MLLTEHLKLGVSPEQTELVLEMMRMSNTAANRVAEIAFEHKTSNRARVHKLTYYLLRDEFKLPAQLAIRAISKACSAYKRDKKIKPVFRPLGAVEQDRSTLSWKGSVVSILSLQGRIKVPILYQGRYPPSARRKGAELIYRDGKFYLAVFVDVPDSPLIANEKWLGVDLGIVNIAVDSDGTHHSDKGLRVVHRRNRELRAKLQKIGTKSAKRLLKKRCRKETRFAKDVNHCISKAVVSKAKGTEHGIKLEDLKGIRDRITVRKAQRADHSSWAFFQLRMFIEYKAILSGVRVAVVDPRNTSRTCLECGLIDKRSRKTRDWFKCIQCGFAGPADYIGAINISRAAITQPNVGHPQPPVESVTASLVL